VDAAISSISDFADHKRVEIPDSLDIAVSL
jgi:hypothetical protein